MVFYLLESIYRVFDRLSDNRKVFKVETIGDCCKFQQHVRTARFLPQSHSLSNLDVAVCGLPEPNQRHAVVMTKFASSCRQKFNTLVSEMVTQLGPDTRDLMLRIGLHSGPVTAGVLRGRKSRFQLFGDTVNTASRMESTGVPTKIHISQETANLLRASGKGHWVCPRETLIEAKGKGMIQTYWAEPSSSGSHAEGTSASNSDGGDTDRAALINWTADIFVSLTKRVKSHHACYQIYDQAVGGRGRSPNATVIDEFKEVIEMPQFTTDVSSHESTSIDLSEPIKKEVYEFVAAISMVYRGRYQN
jgi:class 3 adenylate cyclase